MTTEQTPLLTRTAREPVRLAALDLVRGVLMVIMAIDHAKEFLANFGNKHEQWFEMPDYKGNVAYFLSRFVTGFCAPGFFMLMGWGVALFVESRRKIEWSWTKILKHFALRGLVLVVLNEVMVSSFRYTAWGITTYTFTTTVLFALGINIFLASVFLWIETAITSSTVVVHSHQSAVIVGIYAVVASVITILPSLYVPSPSEATSKFSFQWLLWFLPRATANATDSIMSVYPPFPWVAHTLWGVGIGRMSKLFKWDSARLGLFNLSCGIAMISLAIPLRYGVKWTSINPELVTPPITESIISFFNNVKYPPSVVYTLIAIGANQALLGILFSFNPTNIKVESGPLMVFGGSSLFFYVSHFYLYFLISVVLRGVGIMSDGKFGWWGFWVCYAMGLVMEYFMCKEYAKFKRGTSKDSLWRLF
ncbi:hypothetical protein BCR33DRAFT_469164 [Rhizoclosmatium globosum]|uniref:Heparan-alpha-glucosaminide N-acetyltransferase catalytic domain-containing protein n=1 Tax=Rhizoclosmatium globosum TaxID=329046 RepID=A0A1Y2BQP5_9FUNG|nr:hypothetical protein BCR33DRAFT_469164 [Rhizoclosmatium globosum]|eukprot:ORY37060.1 hypothetical protein BCR33DRAFT_469164 [Rhizoclosmatium globosum]